MRKPYQVTKKNVIAGIIIIATTIMLFTSCKSDELCPAYSIEQETTLDMMIITIDDYIIRK